MITYDIQARIKMYAHVHAGTHTHTYTKQPAAFLSSSVLLNAL